MVCWIADSDGSNNSLLSAIPQRDSAGDWVLFLLPTLKGISGQVIRKGFELSLPSSGLSKARLDSLSQSGIEYDLYVLSGSSMPTFCEGFVSLIHRLGNIVLRSSQGIVLVERVSISRSETWEQEARELLRITKLLKECL